MLELAKECEKLLVYTHVSTAYVNCNRRGDIEETVYDLPGGQDPEEVIESIIRMGPQRVQEQEANLIGDWPNTYTYTKSMAERSLKKNHGNLRVAIVRPSIIVSCYDEPCRGWSDTLAAAGGLTWAMQTGLIHYIKTYYDCPFDLIPCDFVTNIIIANTAYTASCPAASLNVAHAATTGKNQFNIRGFTEYVMRSAQEREYIKQIADPSFQATPNDKVFKTKLYLTEKLPTKIMHTVSRVTRNK